MQRECAVSCEYKYSRNDQSLDATICCATEMCNVQPVYWSDIPQRSTWKRGMLDRGTEGDYHQTPLSYVSGGDPDYTK